MPRWPVVFAAAVLLCGSAALAQSRPASFSRTAPAPRGAIGSPEQFAAAPNQTTGRDEKPGGLLERLKLRNPVQRWQEQIRRWRIDLPATSRPTQRRIEPNGNRPRPRAPALPFPNSNDRGETPFRSPIPDRREPLIRTAQAGQDYQPITPAEKPEDLPKVTEILPYGDYVPEETRKRIRDEKRTVPEEVWTKQPYEPRVFPESAYTWEASNLYHNPLYFEDPALERYGHTLPHYLQPFASGGRFMTQLIGLPYQMTIDPIHRKVYTLGWYRPGECAPKLCYQVPWNTRAAAVQAGTLTGLIFLIP